MLESTKLAPDYVLVLEVAPSSAVWRSLELSHFLPDRFLGFQGRQVQFELVDGRHHTRLPAASIASPVQKSRYGGTSLQWL
jgi:hypothetical protein